MTQEEFDKLIPQAFVGSTKLLPDFTGGLEDLGQRLESQLWANPSGVKLSDFDYQFFQFTGRWVQPQIQCLFRHKLTGKTLISDTSLWADRPTILGELSSLA